MINLLNDSYWKQTHATCIAQHADDWKRDRETRQRIDHNTVYHDAWTTTPVHACWKTTKDWPPVQKKRHITQLVTVPSFPPKYAPTTPSNLVQTLVEICYRRVERSPTLRITILGRLYQITRQFQIWRFDRTHHPLTCLLATFPLLTNAVYSSYYAETITPDWNVSCVAGIHNWIWHVPSVMRVNFQIFNWNWFVPSRDHQLFFLFTTPPENHQRSKISQVPSHSVYASTCLPSFVFSLSSSISHLPQQSSLEITRFSNLCASCVQHLVCERMHVLHFCPLWFQFRCVPNQQTSILLATTMSPWCLPTLPSPLLGNCSVPQSVPDCGHAISFSAMITAPLVLFRVTWSLVQSESVWTSNRLTVCPLLSLSSRISKHCWHVFCAFDKPQKSLQLSHLQSCRTLQLRTH